MKGRRSEVEFLNGLVVRKGREAKVPTPLNEAIASLDRQVEQGTLKPDQSNLPMLEKLIARPSS
jgi:2-dehydropantoate 2-reductase